MSEAILSICFLKCRKLKQLVGTADENPFSGQKNIISVAEFRRGKQASTNLLQL